MNHKFFLIFHGQQTNEGFTVKALPFTDTALRVVAYESVIGADLFGDKDLVSVSELVLAASKREVLIDLVKKSTSVLFDGYTWKIDHTKPVTDGFYALLTEGTSSPVFINFDNVPASRVFLAESIINEKPEKEKQMTSDTPQTTETTSTKLLTDVQKTIIMKVASVATHFLPAGEGGRRFKVQRVDFAGGAFECVLEGTTDVFTFYPGDVVMCSKFYIDGGSIDNLLHPQIRMTAVQGRTVSTFNLC